MFQVSMTSDFFGNVMNMFSHFRENIYNFVDGPVDTATYTWSLITFPFTVNAYHINQLNRIGRYIYIYIFKFFIIHVFS